MHGALEGHSSPSSLNLGPQNFLALPFLSQPKISRSPFP